MTVIDRFGRPVLGLRISLTPSSKCNFNCVFCHKEGIYDEPDTLMTPEEIERIVRILMDFDVRLVKLTGGEPMLRNDILEIVGRLGRLGLRDLSMTTNGTRFPKLARELRKRGLMRVNMSLHSVDPRKYCWIITGTDAEGGVKRYEYTVDAIRSAVEAGLRPVKLNVVVMRGINDDEIDRFIEFTGEMGGGEKVMLQLIELVPEGEASEGEFFKRYYYSLEDVERRLEREAEKIVVRTLHMRRQYLLPTGVWVELVRPSKNCDFCMNNTRMRITYDGKFKPCLMRDDNHVDFLTAMRSGASDEELKELFLRAVWVREPFWKPPKLTPSPSISFTDPGQEALLPQPKGF